MLVLNMLVNSAIYGMPGTIAALWYFVASHNEGRERILVSVHGLVPILLINASLVFGWLDVTGVLSAFVLLPLIAGYVLAAGCAIVRFQGARWTHSLMALNIGGFLFGVLLAMSAISGDWL